jgi:RNA polymerase sigma-70 factor (ECF subfamily)
MLGSVADAEDIVQDVWVRWQTTDRSRIRNPQAFLVVAATRLAINVLQSARSWRETCAGSWLPEPADTSPDPALETERGEALNAAVLLLVERLLPTERAAYVLRQAFDYPYREIADILHVEEANARQLVTRARDHVFGERRAPVSAAQQRRLLNAFVAARTGDLSRLESLFALNVLSTSDDGSTSCAPASRRDHRDVHHRSRVRRRGDGRVHQNEGTDVRTRSLRKTLLWRS